MPSPDGFTGAFFQQKRKQLFPAHAEASINLIPKPDNSIRKRQISLMSLDAKIPNKILAYQILQHVKNAIKYD